MMKNYLRFFAIALVIVLSVGLFAGCAPKEEVDEGKAAIVSKQQTSGDVSVAFVEALATGDYETAVSLTEAYTEDGFFVASDIEWYLPRSSFSGTQKLGFETFKSSVSGSEFEGRATHTVTLYDAAAEEGSADSKSFTVESVLTDDNIWVVSAPEFYCSNFLFRTAGGDTSVFIDEQPVPSAYSSGDRYLYKEFVIPYIGKNDVEVHVKSENFDYKQSITPNSNNNASVSVSVYPPVEDPEKCFGYVKDSWNALCAKYLVGEPASCVQDYIAADASYDICNLVWDGFEALHVGDSSQGGVKNENYNLTVCKASSKGDVQWISDTQIECYFDYELTWYYTLGKTNQSTHQNSSVILSLEKGVYKFYELTDTGLFFEANNYSSEW